MFLSSLFCIVDVGNGGINFVQVVVETGCFVVAAFILIVEAQFQKIVFVPLPAQGEVAVPLLFIQAAEIAHGFLAVQFEQAECAVIILYVHHLASVRFFASCLAVRAAPGQFPTVLFAEVVKAVQLVVLQSVDMCDVIASGQLVVFGICSLTALVSVCGITRIEESIANAVVPAQRVAYVS